MFFILWALALAQPLHAANPPGRPSKPKPPEFHPSRILVKPKVTGQNLTASALSAVHAANGALVLRSFAEMGGLQVVQLPAGLDIQQTVAKYRQSGAVEYAEPDYLVHVLYTPNDPKFPDQWNMREINSQLGWDWRREATNVIVAILDSGIRVTHEDLAANLWTNPREIAGNSLDDDRDGYVDDVHGFNAIAKNGNIDDDNGHGTHVAGIIGAVGNNHLGVCGVAWKVQLMACKFLDANGNGYTSDAITCFQYAQAHGANIINNSWGDSQDSQALRDAVSTARMADIIVVAGAGNNGNNNDLIPFYPASIAADNVVSVTAMALGGLADYSNYGIGSVDIGVPGDWITSTWNTSDSAYEIESGTSMAAAMVSGVCALLKAQFPQDTHVQLLNRLYSSAVPRPSLLNKCRTGGEVNLVAALGSINSCPANDTFRSNYMTAVITLDSFTIKGNNTGATKEPGEPDHAGNVGGKSIWWLWQPSRNGIATITTDGSSFNTLLGVYTGTVVSNLTQIAANDDSSPGVRASMVTFDAQGGVTYRIAVDGFKGGSGTVLLNVSLQLRPTNDDFANRLTISGPVTLATGSNVLATSEMGEPSHAGETNAHSVWWTWTPVNSETVSISTEGSDFDTILAVYTGSSVSNLTWVAENDDDPRGGTVTSRVTFNVVAGVPYQIAAAGRNGATGQIVLSVPPSNDHFSNRILLSGDNCTATGYNAMATADPMEPNHADMPGGKSVWWSWTAASNGPVSIHTLGSSFDTLLAVYTGDQLGSLLRVAANDNDIYGDITSMVRFEATAGTTYQIAVDGASGASGKVILSVSTIPGGYAITELLPPPGFDQTGTQSLNNNGTVVGSFIGGPPDYINHACIWTPTGACQPLPPQDKSSYAWGINDLNQVVGYVQNPGSIASLWQDGVAQELGTLCNGGMSEALKIDNSGNIVGWSSTSNDTIHAVLWQNAVMKDLGATDGFQSFPTDIKDPSFVIGFESFDYSKTYPLLWLNGKPIRLPMPTDITFAQAAAVNSVSEIVGHYEDSGHNQYGCLWYEGTLIGTGAANEGSGFSINNLGQIVGDDQVNAKLWENGKWTRLDTLVPADAGWQNLFMAYKINDRGQIGGCGLRNGLTRGFLMTPLVPVTPRAVITSPNNNQTLLAGDIPIVTTVYPYASNAIQVDFFVDAQWIGMVTNPPFSFLCQNFAPGQHSLQARTLSVQGGTALSQIITVFVVSRLNISSSMTSNGQLILAWPASDASFLMESATNLTPPVAWSPLTNLPTLLNATNVVTLVPDATCRFFRLRRQ